MSGMAGSPRLLLRAEMVAQGRKIVTHTVEVSSQRLVLEDLGDDLDRGADVAVHLSFPRLIAPLEVRGTVGDRHASEAPGDLATVAVDLVFRSPREQADVDALLARLTGEPRHAAPTDGEYRVLLVEDNALIRDMFAFGVRKYFQSRQSHVVVDLAPDGAQAWDMVTGIRYDLLIVDYYLPVLDGSKLVARLRGDERVSATPVVAISAGGAEARHAMLGAGADLYLDKPIVLKDLFAMLERLTA
jgi:CheY-like chemotaxis protein